MKCMIPGINVKVLARAIHALAKIGDELYIEPLPEGISFRTVNSSRSAYASFNFAPSFFINYSEGNLSSATQGDDEADTVKCKVSMKSCIAVFKSPNSIDKHVETCMLRLDPDDNKLIFQFRCRYGILKNHYLPIIECETLQAVYTKDLAPNVLIAEPKLLVDALHNFQHNQEELTFAVTSSKIVLRNFTDFSNEPQKVIRTELCLESGEFVQFKVRGDTSITFCLKEFRALLSFAESVMLPIAINFDTSGRPVVFVITHPQTFEVNFVLATLMQQGDSQQVLTPQPASNATNKRPSSIYKPNSSFNNSKRAKFAAQDPCSSRSVSLKESCNGTSVKKKGASRDGIVSHNASEDSIVLDNLGEEFDMDWENVNDAVAGTKGIETNSKTPKDNNVNMSVCVDRSRITENRSGIATVTPPSHDSSNYTKQRESDITDTPLSSVSVVYRRCFQDTFHPSHLPGYDEVLAPDSDEEPD
ncbi:cell cycle checkpoint control protein RAD9A [Ischnura elegans]|uniref:cell cycle checkpoint control protein RAD9A n=1 Tax=Ischnura elegans TaxID=197161 RepID=UPI001ED89BB5|nr:cell cycle checkpoint control protein RAD9A [Ischnura elegans]